MKKFLTALLLALLTISTMIAAQQGKTPPAKTPASDANKPAGDATEEPKKKRPPIFRANKEQIEKTQEILKQRSFYAGEITGKLDPDTRAGLKKYQEAEGLKVTGTLTDVTLDKMKIPLTDKQKEVVEKRNAMKQEKAM